jgi:1-acyl-sn-glycerol-3-phosphate acyltransferase
MSFYDVIWFLFAGALRLVFRIRREGCENLPASGPVIVCSNHRSDLDPVLLGATLTRPLCFMAKEELFRVPVLSGLIRLLGAFPVRRGKGDTEAIRKSLRVLKDGKVLAMFPEGTRLREGTLPATFKAGVALFAYKTGADILPAAIVCKGKVRPFKRIRVVIGKPIKPAELGFTDGSTENLRHASSVLRDRVVALMEENH